VPVLLPLSSLCTRVLLPTHSLVSLRPVYSLRRITTPPPPPPNRQPPCRSQAAVATGVPAGQDVVGRAVVAVVPDALQFRLRSGRLIAAHGEREVVLPSLADRLRSEARVVVRVKLRWDWRDSGSGGDAAAYVAMAHTGARLSDPFRDLLRRLAQTALNNSAVLVAAGGGKHVLPVPPAIAVAAQGATDAVVMMVMVGVALVSVDGCAAGGQVHLRLVAGSTLVSAPLGGGARPRASTDTPAPHCTAAQVVPVSATVTLQPCLRNAVVVAWRSPTMPPPSPPPSRLPPTSLAARLRAESAGAAIDEEMGLAGPAASDPSGEGA